MIIAGLVLVSVMSVLVNAGQSEKIAQSRTIAAKTAMMADVKEDVEDAAYFLYRFATGDVAALSEVQANLDEIATEGQRARTLFANADGSVAQTGMMLAAAIDAVAALSDRIAGLPEVDTFDRRGVVERELLPVLSGQAEAVDAAQQALTEERSAVYASLDAEAAFAQVLLLVINGVVIAGSVGCALFFGRQLAAPVRRLDETVKSIADRNYTVEVPDTARRDEVGAIARALSDLRNRLAESDAEAEAEQARADRRLALFKSLGDSMAALSRGDVSRRMDGGQYRELGADYVRLCEDFNGLSIVIADLFTSLRASIDTVAQSSQDLSGMSDELSTRAETQAATLEETAAAIEELSQSVSSAADRAGEADIQVEEGRRRAEEGGVVMEKALMAMGSIAKSSERITQIIGVIDDIAFQTNLLALNAGVEAARAGESGKGFSVVASEVRSLAQRASESAREIKDLVIGSTKEVEDGEKLVQETSVMLGQIVESVKIVSGLVSEIATSAKEQASGLREINTGMSELDSVTQKNAAMVNETTAASTQLKEEAGRLADLLAQFSQGAAVEAVSAPVAARRAPVEPAPRPTQPAQPAKPPIATIDKPAPAPMKKASGSDLSLWQEF
ncbi:HAMP domain-containing protein [Aestuariicoccus sp. KMU-90]|uniref:HAMP domain-containing protein n=2 Tax=Thetidibacter halocola TaxID=2827239 RepID=A0A8J7WBZ3_9RHOB|nr:HAMP domain-containing protein [Thetidibacter halocola]